jgi:hypothetical protein
MDLNDAQDIVHNNPELYLKDLGFQRNVLVIDCAREVTRIYEPQTNLQIV